MSGECDRCGWHCLECACDGRDGPEMVFTVSEDVITALHKYAPLELVARLYCGSDGISRFAEEEAPE
jgi:hypothetical protein